MRAEPNQYPTTLVVPKHVGSDLRDVVDIMGEAGAPLLWWQVFMLAPMLCYDKKGKWAAKQCGSECPRQNGKTRVIVARSVGEMLLYKGVVIYTSQLQKTSTETYEEVADLFGKPSLLKYVEPGGFRSALGREEIRLKNGGRIKFLARTRNGGNGQHGTLLIYDEAQAVDDSAIASFSPAIASRGSRTARGSQTVFNGTCPGEGDFGEVFERVRSKALSGKSRKTSWIEWSAGYGGTPPSPTDADVVTRVNPSIDIILDREIIAANAESMSREHFAHQHLGWWSERETAVDYAISQEEWAQSAIDEIGDDYPRRTALAVRMSRDGSYYVLAGAKADGRGNAAVELVSVGSTLGGTLDLARDIVRKKRSVSCVAVDGPSAQALVANIEAIGAPKSYVVSPRPSDVAEAASAFLDGLRSGTVYHTGQPELEDSALHAVRRPLSRGWAFGPSRGYESTAVEAAALAVWAVRNSKRDPRRRQMLL